MLSVWRSMLGQMRFAYHVMLIFVFIQYERPNCVEILHLDVLWNLSFYISGVEVSFGPEVLSSVVLTHCFPNPGIVLPHVASNVLFHLPLPFAFLIAGSSSSSLTRLPVSCLFLARVTFRTRSVQLRNIATQTRSWKLKGSQFSMDGFIWVLPEFLQLYISVSKQPCTFWTRTQALAIAALELKSSDKKHWANWCW
jgi:hypothetical protein